MQSNISAVESQLDKIVSGNEAKATLEGLEILLRLLTNIVKNPGEDKYRMIKGTNAKIKATLFALDGAAALMPLM